MDEATIALNSANASLSLLKDQLGPQSVQSAKAQVQQAESSVNYASVQVQNTILTSPISGMVSARNVDVGEITSNATPAFTVIDTTTVVAKINVPDKMIVQLKKGQTVPVKVSALSDKQFNGTINLISPATDSKTNSYEIDVNIDNADNELKSGMFAKVILPSEQKNNVLTIPNEAISMENRVAYVDTVDKITEIVSGLKAGDNVITEGQIFLSDGQKVNIQKSQK
ncbi:efflux RND transporter periplasmic adaptor subunit [Desulfosporosinus sp. SB140]|uniref:efflux RND transporter periplasmic adaptor subunit n=1 Tax=Desulfosporosinus paludis TaxID=3115649 RepID=UPI00388DEDB2